MGHTHAPYEQFNIACLMELLRIIRTGVVREELALFCKCLHVLIGGSLLAAVGEPPGPMETAVFNAGADPSLEDLQECYSALAGMKEDGPGIYGAGESALDPATITMLIQLGMMLIKAWIDRKKAA